MTTRLQDRLDLIKLVAKQAPSRACRRACLTGKVEVLGGFRTEPPGWVVKTTAKHGQIVYAIVIPVAPPNYQVREIQTVPWHLWAGNAELHAYSIYCGDHPIWYAAQRDAALCVSKTDNSTYPMTKHT